MLLRKKAQIEFIYILAIIGVLVMLVSLSYFKESNLSRDHVSEGKLPANVEEEMKLVKDSMINFMRKAAYETLKIVEMRGGYLEQDEFEAGSFIFMNDNVPYWVKCDTTYIPSEDEVKSRIEKKIKEYIQTHRDEIESIFGKNVFFDLNNTRVEANILDNKINFNIYLPTTVRGYSVEQPYTFSMTTEFGRIYDFARDFAISQSKERYFEYFTLASIYTSAIIGKIETDEAHPSLPVLEDLLSHRCTEGIEERIDRSKDMLSEYLEKVIKHALTNVLWWVPMPDQSGTNYTKTFSIESVNGKKYTDLNEPGPRYNITFTLPDNFSINFNKEIHVGLSDPLVYIERTTCSKTNFDACIRTYSFDYDFTFPVNVRVKDKFLNQYFNFGVMSSIKNMLPGGC